MVEGGAPVSGRAASRVDKPGGPPAGLRRPAAVGGKVKVAGEPDVRCHGER